MHEDRVRDVVPGDAIEDLDDRTDFDFEPGFLEHLARHRRFEGFPELDRPAGNAPLAGQRIVLALDDQDAPVLDDNRTDADERAIGILAPVVHSPITFTTTRFCRCPSNSA
jgi:hypothetical protein